MEQLIIRGNFIGAAIVCIINLILVDMGVFGILSKPKLISLNIILDALIIILMSFAFK